ncbi:MAG: c-type cytochrome biogenesis protein CcmI [Candidatus Binatus sp.]|uniref:c-type cytochrome biogenesis protein CcmI n=1 Tax=Candidatus Binatus sp. TaxID=2811406 RepID=UPI003C73E37C
MFILAAALIVAGVALFVAAPLGIGLIGARAKSSGEIQVERDEHDRALAVQGLRELEFDREMGKLSDEDYESMHKALEDRALTAMAAVENFHLQTDKAARPKKLSSAPLTQAARRPGSPARRTGAVPTPVAHAEPPRPPQSSPSPARKIRFCSQCGAPAAADSKFCAQCGLAIKPTAATAAWTE